MRSLALGLALATVASTTHAQPRATQPATGFVHVTASDTAGAALNGVIVSVEHSLRSVPATVTQTDVSGTALVGPLPAGTATLRARRLGYRDYTASINISAADTLRVSITLFINAQSLGAIRVVALRGDLTPDQRIDRERIAASVPHDAADVLREMPGTDAMRRGALGLDPVIRGLRDTQLGVYIDAARTFPGGPAGMDTPMSHVDPAHVQSMEVISGPYALTWGAGNLSAIRVTTNALPEAGAAPLAARLISGYDGNLNASELAGTLQGSVANGRLRYTTGGALREGDDYTAGDGTRIASGFQSREGRAKVGVTTGEHSMLSVLGAVQAQRDIDYPGRPLDAVFFDSQQWQAEWSLRRPSTGPRPGSRAFALRDVDVMAYVYDVDHLMDNNDKPTALANPNRTPPFPLLINTFSGVTVRGGRVSARLVAPSGWDVLVGGDVYDADHDAYRQTDRRDTGTPIRTDLIWGGARIMDAGAFARIDRMIGSARLAATVRLDMVNADTDSASAFFVEQYGNDLSSQEWNWSGATTLRIPVGNRWSVTAGVGSVVRTAEANERFSDRAAAKRAQTNAEFIGDPGLRPERSTQGDLWLEGRYNKLQLQVNAFARQLDDYITIQSTDLPRRQAGSPPPVFRFVNGRATYVGGEVIAVSPVTSALTLSASLALLRGDDETLNEPALGVTPMRSTVRARYAAPTSRWFVESAAHIAGSQTRVATTRGERATSGWTTVDLQGGVRLPSTGARELSLRVGARNLLDRAYVQHLTALNAFSTGRILEPGRVLFARVTMGM